jgi:uncharacterized membrane protein YbhN (UPF0104 family)
MDDTRQDEALKSIKISKIFIPIMLGIVVVFFLFYRQFDAAEVAKINWSIITVFWFFLAFGFLALRIISYALRLKILSQNIFGFWKSIQLIFIWEFSSAVSPTNVGGSAVALFVLSQEKIGAAKTTAIVIYTIVLDTLFFLISIPFWLLIFGSNILGPGRDGLADFGGWEVTLIFAYVFMLIYGSFFFYGLFYRPKHLQKIALLISKVPFLKKYKNQFIKLSSDLKTTSRELYRQSLSFHLKAFLYTAGAWSSRFLMLICIIIGIVQSLELNIHAIAELYARIQTMFVIMAFSPTPGSAGLAEILLSEILIDYIPSGISLVVASIWRVMGYYFFLLMGVIIIPHWVTAMIKAKKRKKQTEQIG